MGYKPMTFWTQAHTPSILNQRRTIFMALWTVSVTWLLNIMLPSQGSVPYTSVGDFLWPVFSFSEAEREAASQRQLLRPQEVNLAAKIVVSTCALLLGWEESHIQLWGAKRVLWCPLTGKSPGHVDKAGALHVGGQKWAHHRSATLIQRAESIVFYKFAVA